MAENIIKTCSICGPLNKDQVYFWKKGKTIVCKVCDAVYQKSRRTKNPDFFKKHGDKYRFIERSPNTNELKCSKCQTIKQIFEFNKYMFNIRYPYCRSCRTAATKIHHDKPENKKQRKWYNQKYEPIAENKRLIKNYGISLEHYNNILKSQSECCAICHRHISMSLTKSGKPKKLAVDHHHLTGAIRGLLCFQCNSGLGNFKENISFLQKAISYLTM